MWNFFWKRTASELAIYRGWLTLKFCETEIEINFPNRAGIYLTEEITTLFQKHWDVYRDQPITGSSIFNSELRLREIIIQRKEYYFEKCVSTNLWNVHSETGLVFVSYWRTSMQRIIITNGINHNYFYL